MAQEQLGEDLEALFTEAVPAIVVQQDVSEFQDVSTQDVQQNVSAQPVVTPTVELPAPTPSSPTFSMDDYLAKCSICFDAHCEFCLEHCRDQFCRACFGRYVGELVRGSSWGVARVEIKCPACMEVCI